MEPWFGNEEADAVYNYMKGGGWVTEFKETEKLEKMICNYLKVGYAVMTNNGTVSLILALLSLDIGTGSEVLVPDLTMIATPNACWLLGIRPILVDIEKNSLCLDLKKAASVITSRTKALVYVSLNGRSGNMREVKKFCKGHHLFFIEDAAQALGSKWGGKYLGTFGDIGCLSFSTAKIITTGQGGAVITDNQSIYRKAKRLKDFGRDKGGSDIHNFWGWNFKFTDLQAVVGIEQMKKLPRRIERKKEIYKRYLLGLSDINDISFIPTDLTKTCPWFIDIYVSNPDKLLSYLKSRSIGSRRIYPPVSSQKIYRDSYGNIKFPVANKFASRGLWLPSSSKLTDNEIDTVIKTIRKYYHV